MHRILINCLILFTLPLTMLAQKSIGEGRIEYEVKINMHRNIPKEREELKAMMPEFNSFRAETLFNATEAVYRAVEEDEDLETPQGGRGRMVFRMGGFMGTQYVNSETEERITAQDFLGKSYLITDTLKVLPWKFTEEEMTIIGYPCKLATYYNEERKHNVKAWFTSVLRPYLGPDTYGTLPGTVLMLEIEEMGMTVTATSIEDKKLRKNDLKKPSSGAKVTRQEYAQIVKEQMEKMRESGGGGIQFRTN